MMRRRRRRRRRFVDEQAWVRMMAQAVGNAERAGVLVTFVGGLCVV